MSYNILSLILKGNQKFLIAFLCFFSFHFGAKAQDVYAVVEVSAHRIQGVEANLFSDLQSKLNDLINGTKWTDDNLSTNERIQCQFNLVINSQSGNNTFSGTLSVQASRPVFNTSYSSPIFAIQDSEVTFKFEPSTVLQFNEQNISGTDPLVSNLPAILAYYIYMIVGFDYDSFSLRGGEKYFKKAEHIALNAPAGNGISGWGAEDSRASRNRYHLVTQVLSPRYAEFRPYWYEYHRKGLDQLLINPNEALIAIFGGIPTLKEITRANTGSYLMAWYFSTKSDEWAFVLNKAGAEEKRQYVQDFIQMDVTNANKYRRVR